MRARPELVKAFNRRQDAARFRASLRKQRGILSFYALASLAAIAGFLIIVL